MRRMPLYLTALCLSASAALAAPTPAPDEAPAPITLSQQDKTDLAKVEAYFNTLPAVQARFTQRAQLMEGGVGTVHGDFKLWRPGRLRITYDAPSHDFIVADGHVIHQWDGQMQQASQMRIQDSLAGFILQHNLSFSGDDVTVTHVLHPAPTRMDITLRSVKEPESGSLTLHLTTVPMTLTGWSVLDAQNLTTEVSFDHLQTGARFERSDFIFRKPE